MKIPSKTQIGKTLTESKFDPRKQGPLAIVAEIGDPSYAETKAIELILDAKKTLCTGTTNAYHANIAQAISLLALARNLRGTTKTERN